MHAVSLARVLPAFDWLRAYDRHWLRSDVYAGITLPAHLLPAALGDAVEDFERAASEITLG
jgi:MFS superfamily sulfate permease-like transporter